MNSIEAVSEFLLGKALSLTEEWYNSIDKNQTAGVYANNNQDVIQKLKQQNYEFHLHFCQAFLLENNTAFHQFKEWVLMVATDEYHQKTPIHIVLKEFFRVQEQYLDYIREFVESTSDIYDEEIINGWNRKIINIFGEVMSWFVEESHKYSQQRLQSQQELINELGSPVILINNNMGLLPIVGTIDTHRAKHLLENTLKQCSKKGIQHLFIDLSGVFIIDTLVAQKIFQLIESLRLIGIKTTLSGIRPEIAATAVQLGISFKNISITPTLSKAMRSFTIN
ncbi:STAS domain-containing protein [Neobacillus terrae]|uniref:STAS domain-containing protein n=1 Tax=Neobacillus terrae TaxID=3034837 RepID=UPI00140894DE|nr:STAS domain-containing protein [Neobacillus terrae]NHM33333.1 STAS domain-containing protein [Neobacillus terrae]